MTTKSNAAKQSVIRVTALIAMKLTVGLLSGSLSILAEALNSLTDLVAAVIAAIAVRMSGTPADTDHPKGHEFIEGYSGIIEASMMFLAAAFIIYEAIGKVMNPTEVMSVELLALGAVVMVISIIVDLKVSKDLLSVATETGSVALMASGQNVRADVFSSMIVLAGLIATAVTGISAIDAVVAVLAAGIFLKVGVTTLGRSVKAVKGY